MVGLLLLLVTLSGCGKNSSLAGDSKAALDYPKKTIEIIVPFSPGGATDVGARILEKYLPKHLPNAQFVVVNKPGGSGTIAITDLYASKPDGYTLALSTHRAIAVAPLYGKTKYSHDSFQPVAKVFGNQQIMVVKGDAPWDNFEDWLDYVKKNPGKFSYGVSGGIGSGAHLPMAELEMMEDLEAKPVPFEGTPPAITGVLGGHVQGAVLQPSDVLPMIESGKLKAIFNAGSEPVPYLPDIPLLKDKGFDITFDSNTSLVAPKDTPKEIVSMLEEAIEKTMKDPEVIEAFKKASLQVQFHNGEYVQKELNDENGKSSKILKTLKLID